MAGWTNRGKYNTLAERFTGVAPPANFYLRLFTSATAPGADTNDVSSLTEIADGNGYSQGTGEQINRDGVDFDVLTQDDVNDRAFVQLRDIVFTAAGGQIPSGGDGARYACLCDATGGAAEVEVYFDLQSDRVISDGQSMTLQDCEIRLTD